MFDKLKSATSGLGNLQEMAAEKLQGTMNEVHASAPYLTRVGYCLLGLQVEIGISPKVILTLSQREVIDPQAFAGVLAEVSGRKVLASILTALQQANALQGKIQVQGYVFRDIEIELGIPPAVRMIFLGAAMAISTPPAAPPPVEVPAIEPPVSLPTPEEPIATAPETSTPAEAAAPALAAVAPAPVSLPVEPVASEPREEPDPLIRFRCPHCGVRYKVQSGRAGESLECRRCGESLTIPSSSSADAPASP